MASPMEEREQRYKTTAEHKLAIDSYRVLKDSDPLSCASLREKYPKLARVFDQIDNKPRG